VVVAAKYREFRLRNCEISQKFRVKDAGIVYVRLNKHSALATSAETWWVIIVKNLAFLFFSAFSRKL